MVFDALNGSAFIGTYTPAIKQSESRPNFNDLKALQLSSKECIYVVDIRQHKIIFQKGVQAMLGFKDQEFSMNHMLAGFHPDDFEVVKKISQAMIDYCSKNSKQANDHVIYITYRKKRIDGSYATVLSRASCYKTHNDTIDSFLIQLTDISFIKKLQSVSWSFESADLDEHIFKTKVYKNFEGKFTKREIQVVRLIREGFTNKQIAEKLFLSKHTVAAHRKNIYKKSDCHNSSQLIAFCMKRNIF